LDIHAEISIPAGSRAGAHFDGWSTIWLITALLRLKVALSVRAPVVSDISFAAVATATREPEFFPLEMNAGVLSGGYSAGMVALSDDHVAWVNAYWKAAEALMKTHPKFFRAFVSCDSFRLARDLNDQVVIIWGGLEQLFSKNEAELRFRAAGVIASYLEEAGPKRLAAFKRVRKAYDQRSKAAHGGSTDGPDAFNDSYQLLRLSLMKMIESDRVPSVDALENNLFDNGLWVDIGAVE
jgi:hypothetical protein